ncbi:peptidylprolyl isomerase [Fulvivirga sp. RKSG066]|uniref:FKBP-type peptidyl-prolyl cis-trans isomerase n=1 Tax=Fulvivirga aurantia TaxID=2529383 RepID=UPI0012BD60CA|nr:FKBP-type peptidyl-prolyl cis-trans isomerase [Fulvivirga aurantia]MTI22043.1 peptidylprolyl isomerase [Fulvivirga aurantia]
MIKLTKSITLLAFVVGFAACNSTTEKKTSSGLSYTVLEKGEGEIPDSSYILLNMKFADANDSVWMSTTENEMPTPTMKVDSLWKNSKGINEIFNMLDKGDSVTFDVSAVDLFSNTFRRPLPPNVDSTEVFTFHVGVEEVLDEEGFRSWQQKIMAQQQAKAAKEAEAQLENDIETIDNYLAENNIEAQKAESGLRYVITEEGNGEQAEAGDKVTVNYIGKVLNGGYFDSSMKDKAQEFGFYNEQREPYEPFSVTLGQGSVIRGWDEGLTYLSEGAKATLYIPSTMAYGPRARGPVIGENSILVFDIELLEVEKGE